MLGHLALITGLLVVAYLFAVIARNAGLPPAAATTLVGITGAGMFGDAASIALTPATLGLFLPALIFDGTWAINGDALRRRAGTIAVLAVPGTILSAVVIACGAGFAGLPVLAALSLGAMLAATDPVAVLALFEQLPIPTDLRTIVEGESIANDGVAAILTTTFVAFAIVIPGMAAPSIPAAIAAGIYAAAAGIAIGAALALVAARLARGANTTAFAIAVTLAIAYGAYGLATLAHGSGIFASAAAGIVLRRAAFAKAERERVAIVWDGIANVANAIVFLLIGLNLKLERIFHEPGLIFATIASTILARVLLAYGTPIRATPPVPRAWRHTLAISGVRGGLSLALALGLPPNFPARAAVVDAVFAVVFSTLIVQGWTLAPILRRLKFPRPARPATPDF